MTGGVQPTLMATSETAPARVPGIAPGTVLFGEYEVIGLAGAGGMGSIYRAVHRSLGESRAIKVMRAELAHDATAVDLFLREARALLEVQHEAVVRCHDLLRDPHGRMYLVMEWIEGPSLADVLRDGPLSPDEARTLLERIASGLAAAHARGVVHRDVSPDNILLPERRADRAKLVDFGISRLVDAPATVLGFRGKLAYASPEQLGLYGGEVGPRSDLYSLGLVVLESVTGEVTLPEQTLAAVVEVRRRRPEVPSGLKRALRTDLKRMLAPDPERRLASAESLVRRVPGEEHRRSSWLVRAAWVGLLVLAVCGAAAWAILVPEQSGESAFSSVSRPNMRAPVSVPAAPLVPSPPVPLVPVPPVQPEDVDVGAAVPEPAEATGAHSLAGPDGDTPNGRDSDPNVCTAEAARTRAAILYASGRPCEAVRMLERCCPGEVRACADMRRVFGYRCAES